MKRRNFVKLCGSSLALGAAGVPGWPGPRTRWSGRRPTCTRSAIRRSRRSQRMGKKLETQTNGRISIQMFPSMQLGGEKEMIEQAQVGALQIARISVGAMGPVVDELNVFNMPFIFRDEAHMRKVIDGPIGAGAARTRSRVARSRGWSCSAGWTPARATSTRTSR